MIMSGTSTMPLIHDKITDRKLVEWGEEEVG
jgi:hypothetical protein